MLGRAAAMTHCADFPVVSTKRLAVAEATSDSGASAVHMTIMVLEQIVPTT